MSPRETPRAVYLPNCPRFVYGSSGDLTLALPATLPDYIINTIGGDIESDAGMRAGFIVRRDKYLAITLRIWESQWVAAQTFIDFAQTGAKFTYYPDSLDTATSFQVRLVEPSIGKQYTAQPDTQFANVLLLPIILVTGAIATPPETDSELPVGLVFDYEADDAVYIDTTPTYGGCYGCPAIDLPYHGVVQVVSKIEGGPPLTIEGARPAYYNTLPPELNEHALIRAFGGGNNNPLYATLPVAVDAPNGVTLWAVHRPGFGVDHGMPFELGDDTTAFAGIGQLIAFGVASGAGTVGGWIRGDSLGGTGELGNSWGGHSFFQPVNWPGFGFNDGPFEVNGGQANSPVVDDENQPSQEGGFNITFMTMNAFGQINMFVNGTKLPYTFSAPPGPYKVKQILVTSSAGGSLDLAGGQQWEWGRVGAYARCLTPQEIKSASRVLGRRYSIATV